MYIFAILFLIFSYDVFSTPELYTLYCDDCDIILGGVIPIYSKDDKGKCVRNSFNDWAMPRAEAMLFAVDQVNKNPNLLGNHTLGIHIQNTCGVESVATNRVKNFLQSYSCRRNTTIGKNGAPSSIYFAGVVGEMYSKVSKTLATFLQPWNIPLVSPASTSVGLSDKSRYKYFARTVPSDKFQNRVIVDILKKLNWTLISTIFSKTSFPDGIGEFKTLAEEKGICNSVVESIPSNPTYEDFENVVCTILKQDNVNVVVLFTNVENTKGLLNATTNLAKGTIGRILILNNICKKIF